MADTTTTSGADTNAGHLGNSGTAVMNNEANKAPADQLGYDPADAKWATLPGAAARANHYPRSG
jgi:hypothetical protein